VRPRSFRDNIIRAEATTDRIFVVATGLTPSIRVYMLGLYARKKMTHIYAVVLMMIKNEREKMSNE